MVLWTSNASISVTRKRPKCRKAGFLSWLVDIGYTYTMRDFRSALRSLVRSDGSKWQPVQQHLHIHELLFRRNTTTIARFLHHATREV